MCWIIVRGVSILLIVNYEVICNIEVLGIEYASLPGGLNVSEQQACLFRSLSHCV
jgi:hypothetical protein